MAGGGEGETLKLCRRFMKGNHDVSIRGGTEHLVDKAPATDGRCKDYLARFWCPRCDGKDHEMRSSQLGLTRGLAPGISGARPVEEQTWTDVFDVLLVGPGGSHRYPNPGCSDPFHISPESRVLNSSRLIDCCMQKKLCKHDPTCLPCFWASKIDAAKFLEESRSEAVPLSQPQWTCGLTIGDSHDSHVFTRFWNHRKHTNFPGFADLVRCESKGAPYQRYSTTPTRSTVAEIHIALQF